MARRYELSAEEWKRIKDLFPPAAKRGRPSKWTNLVFINAMLWLARSGSAWQELPSYYPPHQTVYSRFCKWRDTGVLEAIFMRLMQMQTLKTLV